MSWHGIGTERQFNLFFNNMKTLRSYKIKNGSFIQETLLVDDSEESVTPPQRLCRICGTVEPTDTPVITARFFLPSLPAVIGEMQHYINLLKTMYNA